MDARKKDDEVSHLTNQVSRFRKEKMLQTALTYDHENDQMSRHEGCMHGVWVFVPIKTNSV